MSVSTSPGVESLPVKRRAAEGTLFRVSKYVLVRLLTLFATVVIGVYLTIMIANMGGFVDTIM